MLNISNYRLHSQQQRRCHRPVERAVTFSSCSCKLAAHRTDQLSFHITADVNMNTFTVVLTCVEREDVVHHIIFYYLIVKQ